MRLTFRGAAGSVTGSCHELEAAGRHLLVDCGMFQGSRRLAEDNAAEFGFDPASIEMLLLTHAHLDHCGRIPLLVKRGFRGRIVTTAATRDLAELVLNDAAALQVEEARYHNHNGGAPGGDEPLYSAEDVAQAMKLMDGQAGYDAPLELAPGLRATFRDAGHILGSASILIEAQEPGGHPCIVFSGDLGNRNKPILNPPEPAPAADAVVMESTYGDRNHRTVAESVREFQQVVGTTLARGGNVVIPTFALERAQDLLYYLREMVEDKQMAAATAVYLDSPMAISATEIFRRHPECFNRVTAAMFAAGSDPFALPGLRMTRDSKASAALAGARGAIIMAGSGMAAGGRIRRHLVNNLPEARNSIVFVGYAAAGTAARAIIDGAHEVRLLGETVPVRAQIHTIGGFSAHADRDELLQWASPARGARIYLVHGEGQAANSLAAAMSQQGLSAQVARANTSVEIAPAAAAAR
jgi:metallo-beta-lactamase family protein